VFEQAGVFILAALVGASDIDRFVLNLAQGGASSTPPSGVAAAVLIAASDNNLAKAGYAVRFGAFRSRPACHWHRPGGRCFARFRTAAVYLP
jgi:hypothetical protein